MSKKMSGRGGQFKISNLKQNDRVIETNEEKANLLADVFSQASSDSNHSNKFLKQKTNFEDNHIDKFTDSSSSIDKESSLNEAFTMSELKKAIKQSKNKTAPGADTITYEMIKNLPRECLEILLVLYNEIWHSGDLPKEWNHAIILPFHKPDKPP